MLVVVADGVEPLLTVLALPLAKLLLFVVDASHLFPPLTLLLLIQPLEVSLGRYQHPVCGIVFTSWAFGHLQPRLQATNLTLEQVDSGPLLLDYIV